MVTISRKLLEVGPVQFGHPIVQSKLALSAIGLLFVWVYLGLVVLTIPMVILWVSVGDAGMILTFLIAVGFIAGVSYKAYNREIARFNQHGEELTPEEYPQLTDTFEFIEAECKRRDMTVPSLLLIPTSIENAAAAGRRNNGYIILFDGLLTAVDEDELQAIIAHEIAHLDNHDALLMTLVVSIKMLIYEGLCKIGYVARLMGYEYRDVKLTPAEREHVRQKVRNRTRYLVGPISFFEKTISRQREFLADAKAAEATEAESMIGALESISDEESTPEVQVSPSLCIVGKSSGFLSRLRSTHPSVKKRIRRLERIS